MEASSGVRYFKYTDILMATGVVGIVCIMLIPIPPRVLDILLAFNITLSLAGLLVAMYIEKPLNFSSFPSYLLVTTLFRLSLNISSTRLILLNGRMGADAAGQIIKAFGSFVVGGNYFVGIVVFLILIVINFVVITRGSTRIAEVAARFTLDAMPGKQMSIDADLNAGLIDEKEARRRRDEIAKEADFYGAMDGASKFVRGDAIAGMLITVINIVGGLIIGVFQNKMSIAEAASTYTILTIGDGLVSQFPALLISTAAGIIISRAATEADMGKEMISQLAYKARPTAILAGILIALGIVPGLPHIPFFVVASLCGILAYTLKKGELAKEEVSEEAKEEVPERIEALLKVDLLELQVGYELIPFVDVELDGELLARIKAMRKQFAQELGFIVPPIHIKDNLALKPSEYAIFIKGVKVASSEVMIDRLLAMDTGAVKEKVEGVPTKEPAFGLSALWIEKSAKEKAQFNGYTVVEPVVVIATHLSEIIRRHAHELLGRQEVQALLDNVALTYPKVVEELVPNLLPLGGVQKVLQNLLREQVPIRDMLTILETLADWAQVTKDPIILTEYVRRALSRVITSLYKKDDTLYVVTLDPSLEEFLKKHIQRTDQTVSLAISPQKLQEILDELNKFADKFASLGVLPVVLVSADIRPYFKMATERFVPGLCVLSYLEVAPDVKVKSIGVVKIKDAA